MTTTRKSLDPLPESEIQEDAVKQRLRQVVDKLRQKSLEEVRHGKSLDPLPEFKTQEEENEFWETHDMGDYIGQVDDAAVLFQKKDKKGVVTRLDYSEKYAIDDPKLTEMVNVRFDKKTITELRKFADDDDRRMTSLIRMWVLQRLKDEKYKRN